MRLTLLLDEGNVDELKRLPDSPLYLQDVAAHLTTDACQGRGHKTECCPRLHHGPGAARTDCQAVGSGQVPCQVSLEPELLDIGRGGKG